MAVGLGAGVKKAIDAASDMNETISKTRTVFGKSGADVEAWGATLAESFGISKQAGLDAAAIFGTFGKAAGLTGGALTKFSKPLVQAAADLASFHNVPVAQALEDIRSGLSGEVEPLRKYGVLLNDAALRQKALELGLVKTTKDALSPQNKMLAAQQLILEKLGPAAGDFARTVGSAANQQRIMAAEAANLTAALGQKLLPMKIAVLKWVNKHWPEIEKVMTAVFTAIQFAIQRVVVPAIKSMIVAGKAVVAWVREHWPEISKVMGKIAAVLVKVFNELKGPIVEAFNAIKAIFMTGVRLWQSIWDRFGTQIKSVVLAVFGFIKGTIQNNLQAIKGLFMVFSGLLHGDWSKVWDGLKLIFGAWVKQIMLILDTLKSGLVAGLQALGPILAGIFIGPWNAIKALATGIWNSLVSLANATWAAITGGLSAAWGAITGLTSSVWNGVRTLLTTIWNGLAGLARTAWAAITGVITTAWNTVTTLTTTAWNAVKTLLTTIWNGLAALAQTAWTAITTVITTGWNGIKALTETVWNGIKTFLTGIWNTLSSAAATAFNAIVSAITGAVGKITDAAKAIGSGIIGGITGALDTVGGAVKGKLDAIWGVISNVAGLALGAARAIGAALMEGIKQGADALWHSVSGWFKDRANDLVHVFTLGLKGSPKLFTYYLGFQVVEQLVEGAAAAKSRLSEITQILGPSLVKAITASFKPVGAAAVKGMNDVGKLIVAAAKKYGVDARAALAVAMGEGGIKFGAVGDKGHSFGPFQMADFGALAHMSTAAARTFANSAAGVDYALRKMAESGAKGLTGLAAIKAIIGGPGWGFERPLNAAASVTKAIEAYKTLGPAITSSMTSAVGAVTTGGARMTAAMRSRLNALAGIVKAGSQVIGLENARGIIEGLDKSAPNLVARATAAMQKALDAQKAVLRTAFVTAFNDLANAALTAFDTRWAAWKPPAQRLLDKMQLAEQIKQVQDTLATAMTAITGGGAFEAGGLAKTLGDQLATAVGGAISAIGGAKTEEALNKISAQVQTQLLAEIDQMALTATNKAQAAVDAARTALTAAQAGGDPDAIAAAQAALDTAVGNQRTLEAAILAEKELALGQLAAAETRRHEAIGAIQREGLAKQLAELKGFMLKHPEEWGKMGASVTAILGSYNTKLSNAGHAWADKFGDGIRAGIPAAVAAARALAAAVAAVLPSTSSPLKPAKTGPLSFHPRTMGKAWATALGAGLASGGLGGIMDSMVPSSLSLGGGGMVAANRGGMVAAGAGGGGTVVNVTVNGALLGTSVPEVAETIRRELYRVKGRNGSLDF